MSLEQFLSIFADAVQFHEGYTETSASFLNNNPGNLRFAHQNGATATPANFAKFPTFYQGKQAQLNQLALDVKKYNTIEAIINSYAPPTENDTQAYINSVITFFAWRNITITPTTPIDQFLATFSKPVILIVIDSLSTPEDWHGTQQAVSLTASFLPLYAFACSYSAVDLSGDVIEVSTPISANTSIISGQATKEALTPFNDGECLNVLIYNGSVMQGHPTPAGGCEYQGVRMAPVSSVSSVGWQGPTFVLPTACLILHELGHELAELLQVPDNLHAWLEARDGYAANSERNLLSYFASNNLFNSQAIQNLKVEKQNL